MTPSQAYGLVRRAISNGALVRPSSCERCGRMPKLGSDGRSCIQAHHHDYNKPLDVEWICSSCHRKETPLPEKIGAPVFGTCNGQAKLDEVSVRSAKRLREKGWTFQSIADRLGVHKSTIIRACRGETWRSA